jgi:deazaflavin-dependent oxidoreductase (nitroreductase family)
VGVDEEGALQGLTTTGRKSGERFIFPLFYWKTGDSYFVVASEGGAPQHPGWYRNILANPEVEVQVGTAPEPPPARSPRGCGKSRWSSSRPTPITSARQSARSRWACWTPSADINGITQAFDPYRRSVRSPATAGNAPLRTSVNGAQID